WLPRSCPFPIPCGPYPACRPPPGTARHSVQSLQRTARFPGFRSERPRGSRQPRAERLRQSLFYLHQVCRLGTRKTPARGVVYGEPLSGSGDFLELVEIDFPMVEGSTKSVDSVPVVFVALAVLHQQLKGSLLVSSTRPAVVIDNRNNSAVTAFMPTGHDGVNGRLVTSLEKTHSVLVAGVQTSGFSGLVHRSTAHQNQAECASFPACSDSCPSNPPGVGDDL